MTDVTLTITLHGPEHEMLLCAAAHEDQQPEEYAMTTLLGALWGCAAAVAHASARIAERSAELNRRLE